MNEVVDTTVSAADAGRRLDVLVASMHPRLSRSLAHNLVGQGLVLVNGRIEKPAFRVSSGDNVRVELRFPAGLTAEPEEIPLTVVYEDSDLAVIDKPAGLVVHPAAGHRTGTLANALAARFPTARSVGQEGRPGIVHRLDKDTSGLMVVALTPEAHRFLQSEIANRRVERRYLALVAGAVRPESGTIDSPVGRDPRDRKRMSVFGVAARPASTSYRVLETLPPYTLLEARLHTGRTHQIRVHMRAVGHPLAGDSRYGGPKLPDLDRQFLHAHRLVLTSPSSAQMLDFASPLPTELERVLDQARKQ